LPWTSSWLLPARTLGKPLSCGASLPRGPEMTRVCNRWRNAHPWSRTSARLRKLCRRRQSLPLGRWTESRRDFLRPRTWQSSKSPRSTLMSNRRISRNSLFRRVPRSKNSLKRQALAAPARTGSKRNLAEAALKRVWKSPLTTNYRPLRHKKAPFSARP